LLALAPLVGADEAQSATWAEVQVALSLGWEQGEAEQSRLLALLGRCEDPAAAQQLLVLTADQALTAHRDRAQREELSVLLAEDLSELERLGRIEASGHLEDGERALQKGLARRVQRKFADEWEPLVDRIASADRLELQLVAALASQRSDAAIATQLAALSAQGPYRARQAVLHALVLRPATAAIAGLQPLMKAEHSASYRGEAVLVLRAIGALLHAMPLDDPRRTDLFAALVSALKAPRWSLRAAAAEELAALGDIAAIEPLIVSLERAVGRDIDDIEAALQQLTAVDCQGAQAWAAWFARNRNQLDAVVTQALSQQREGRTVGTLAFFTLRTHSQRPAFAIDVSASMDERGGDLSPAITGNDTRYPTKGTKLQIAGFELHRALGALESPAQVGVLYFNHFVRLYGSRALHPVSNHLRRDVLAWTRFRVQCYGRTDLHEALRQALILAWRDDGIDTLFLLTDGTPTSGGHIERQQLLPWLAYHHRQMPLRVHVIGIGQDVDAGLLRDMAQVTGGRCVMTHR
jgi:hypothetical protein